MKYNYLFIVCLFFSFSTFSQENDWELPMKNDYICYEFSHQFKNTKKDMKDYFQESIHPIAEGTKIKSKGIAYWEFNYSVSFNPYVGVYMNNNMKLKDTLLGELEIIKYNYDDNFKNYSKPGYSISAEVKIIFSNKNNYSIKFKNFNIVNYESKSFVKKFLEDDYKEFINKKKKKGYESKTYSDLNYFVKWVNDKLNKDIERAINTEE